MTAFEYKGWKARANPNGGLLHRHDDEPGYSYFHFYKDENYDVAFSDDVDILHGIPDDHVENFLSFYAKILIDGKELERQMNLEKTPQSTTHKHIKLN